MTSPAIAAAKARARQVREDDARRTKALRLFTAARSARDGEGFTGDEVAAFVDGQWELLEAAAGTRPASDTTRQLVVSMLRNQQRIDRRLAGDAVFAKLRGEDDGLFDGLS